MCFSAQASFTAGVLLTLSGAVCVLHAARMQPQLRVLAAMPFFFGAQQLIEGCVWLALNAGDPAWVRALSMGFLFFAFLWWPLYCPLAVLPLEACHRQRHLLLLMMTLCGGLLGILIYVPVLSGQVELSTQIVDHCIRYETDRADTLKHTYTALYLLLTVTPFAIASHNRLKVFAALLLISIGVAAYFYKFAFFSVWCFFAACLSLCIAWVLKTQNRQSELAWSSQLT
jgi:hypothetical protein